MPGPGDTETKISLKDHCPTGPTSVQVKEIPGILLFDEMDISYFFILEALNI